LWLPPVSLLFPYTTLFRSKSLNLFFSVGAKTEVEGLRRNCPSLWNLGFDDETVATGFMRGECHIQGSGSPISKDQGLLLKGRSKDRKSTRLNSSHVKISYA